MKTYLCTVCDYLYDEESAEKNHEEQCIPFEDLPEDWQCPNCGVRANQFKPVEKE